MTLEDSIAYSILGLHPSYYLHILHCIYFEFWTAVVGVSV